MTCRLLAWHKPDGGLKEMSARVAMLRMQADGLISLPPPRGKRPDPTIHLTTRTNPDTPIKQPAGKLAPLTLHRIQHKPESGLWNEYIQRYHYLGHKPLPGAQLRYLIHHRNRPLALLGASCLHAVLRDDVACGSRHLNAARITRGVDLARVAGRADLALRLGGTRRAGEKTVHAETDDRQGGDHECGETLGREILHDHMMSHDQPRLDGQNPHHMWYRNHLAR